MKVLLIGSGGREHALAHAICRSEKLTKLYIAPGNGGMQGLGECVPLKVDDIKGIKNFVFEQAIDWTVIGPELPLTLGLADELRASNLKCFGVNKDAAQLEGSKLFSKRLLMDHSIPTASYKEFGDYNEAQSYLEQCNLKPSKYPLVVKADGLAAGKGVYICSTQNEGEKALKKIFIDRKFGDSGNRLVIEDFLEGQEISAFAFSDGKTVVPLIYAQDYKKLREQDQGPNTGGMGSYAPAPFMTQTLQNAVYETVLKPTIDALKQEGITYKGILYAGLMIKGSSIKVLEFNVRFGDPEAQVILPLLKTDILDIFDAVESQTLDKLPLEWSGAKAVCIVLASGGYPDSYKTGYPISGLDETKNMDGIILFHAGTKEENGRILTSGGRVLNVVALNDTLEEAQKKANMLAAGIQFDNKYYRRDIALNIG